MRLVVLSCSLLALTCAVSLAAQEQSLRRRVAVMPFDYTPVNQEAADLLSPETDFGKGLAAILVTELVENGTYVVLEREQLDRVLAEQDLQQSGRVDPATAVRVGQMLGAEAIVVGTVTRLAQEEQESGVSSGISVGPVGIGGVKRKMRKVVMVTEARLVSIATGEIVAAVTGEGAASRSSTTVQGNAQLLGVRRAGAVDMGTTEFQGSLVGEAVYAAAAKLAALLAAQAGRIPPAK
jgi:curli biogenesis system outer membrane secretion channel CsgG